MEHVIDAFAQAMKEHHLREELEKRMPILKAAVEEIRTADIADARKRLETETSMQERAELHRRIRTGTDALNYVDPQNRIVRDILTQLEDEIQPLPPAVSMEPTPEELEEMWADMPQRTIHDMADDMEGDMKAGKLVPPGEEPAANAPDWLADFKRDEYDDVFGAKVKRQRAGARP